MKLSILFIAVFFASHGLLGAIFTSPPTEDQLDLNDIASYVEEIEQLENSNKSARHLRFIVPVLMYLKEKLNNIKTIKESVKARVHQAVRNKIDQLLNKHFLTHNIHATTQNPTTTTTVRVTTTQKPVTTTKKPIQTTQMPIPTTQKPIQTTQKPIPTTPKLNTTQNPITPRPEIIMSTTIDSSQVTEPEVCYLDNELVIAIDASSSVGSYNYHMALKFAARMVTAWKKHSGNGVAVFSFSSSVHKVFNLKEGALYSAKEAEQKVLGTPYFRGSTATDLALDQGRIELMNSNKPARIPRNIITLTDGRSDSPYRTIVAARKLTSAGIRSVAIGIGDKVDNPELVEIAGMRPDRVFTPKDFDELINLLKPVSQIICS